MAKVVKHEKPPAAPIRAPAKTLKGREDQLISLAMDEAERQMRAGTASSQIITAFLKLGTTRELLEQERLRHENELTKAKVDQLAQADHIEELYKEAIRAMRVYSGQDVEFDDMDAGDFDE